MPFKIQTPTILSKTLTTVSRFVTKIENHRLLAHVPKKIIRPVLALVMMLILGSAIYFPVASLTEESTTEEGETLQTANVRTGDLVIYASGTGTLIAADEVDLGFKTSGQVKVIYFEVGDQVEKGDLLAEVDDSDARIKYTQANRSLLELTSQSAAATAQTAIADAQTEIDSAIGHLGYLISPAVLKWEGEVEEAEDKVNDAKTALEADPSNEKLQEKLKDAEDYLDFSEDTLYGNRDYYDNEYLPEYFTAWDRTTGEKYIAVPSEAVILEARARVSSAEAGLQEAEWLYAALTGGKVPENATGAGLSELEDAKLNLESAQLTLDGTKIYAPISGTIMFMDLTVGDTASTSSVITVADLSQYYLEIFLDETDWANVKAGYETEITFDALPDQVFTGEVTQVDPGLYSSGNTSVVRALVKLETSEAGINLPIGTAAAVDVIGGKAENAVLIPIEALHQAGDQYTVFVMENGQPRLRMVEVGIQDSLYAEIKSGLEAGEEVTTGITETQ